MTTPSPPTTLTARSPEDLLAAAAIVLGFWPSDSVVMLTFGCRHPFHARVDLPDDLADLRETAESLAAPAAQHRAERVVLLVYTEDTRVGDAAWRSLRTAFRHVRIEVLDALRVGPRRWHPLGGGDAERRRRGMAYDVTAHPFLAAAILDGRVTLGSREELAASLEPDLDAVRRVEALLPAGPTDRDRHWLAELLDVLLDDERTAAGLELSDAHVARILVALTADQCRDAAWALVDRESSPTAVTLWRLVLRRAPAGLSAAPAALLAWSAWQQGNGALAWLAVDRCRSVAPDDDLATLVADCLERAVPPSAVARLTPRRAS